MAMFRFLLEAHGHLAYFTVRDAGEGSMDVVFSPDMTALVERALDEIGRSVPLERMDAVHGTASSSAGAPAGPHAQALGEAGGEIVGKML